jgi:ABC-type multidrug transport system ATPase subunit
MKAPEFHIRALHKNYDKHPALKGISLEIKTNSMNFLLGANGSGKSTLLKCLAGHQDWNSGEIYRHGQSRSKDHAEFNRGLHFISEEIVPPKMPLTLLAEVYKSIHGNWDDELFKRFLTWSGLNSAKNLEGVSRGQRIQALMALSLATSPEVLLVDEATAVLDPFIRNRLISEIETLHKKTGMTVVIASNIATELTGLQGRLIILRDGQVVIDREAENVSHGFCKIRVEPEDKNKAIDLGLTYLDRNSDGSHTFIGPSHAINNPMFKYKMDQRNISFEEIFMFFSDRKAA